MLIKATAGGGGRGMRVASNDLALKSAIQQAAAEAEAAFGNAGVYLERYIERPAARRSASPGRPARQRRASLGARLLDAAPASEADRGKPVGRPLGRHAHARCAKSAVRLIKTAGYTNAGTVEFIVDHNGNFYFIEVNARIQVEHPVTEMVTGIDLIKSRSASPPASSCRSRRRTSSAPARRSNAASTPKTPSATSSPRPARSRSSSRPGGFGVRFDSHAYSGYTVPPYYDSMIGKLIVHARRAAKRSTACSAPGEMKVEGITTTIPLAPGNPRARRLLRIADRHDVRRAHWLT